MGIKLILLTLSIMSSALIIGCGDSADDTVYELSEQQVEQAYEIRSRYTPVCAALTANCVCNPFDYNLEECYTGFGEELPFQPFLVPESLCWALVAIPNSKSTCVVLPNGEFQLVGFQDGLLDQYAEYPFSSAFIWDMEADKQYLERLLNQQGEGGN